MKVSTMHSALLAVLGTCLSFGVLAPGAVRIPFGLVAGIALPCFCATVWLTRETDLSSLFGATVAFLALMFYWAACGFLAAGLGVGWGGWTGTGVCVGANLISLIGLRRVGGTSVRDAGRSRLTLPSVFPAIDNAVRYALVADFEPNCPVPSPSEWADAAPNLVRDRLSGVSLRLIRDNAIDVPAEVARRLREAEFGQAVATGLVMTHAAEIIDRLSAMDVRTVILKGPGIAAKERSLQERPFGDLDVLVHPKDFRRSLATLREAGLTESNSSAQPWDWCNKWCREAVNLKRGDGAFVDLHHHIPPWLWTRQLTFDHVWNQSEWLSVGAATMRVPSPAHRALLACLHVISDHGRPGETTRIWRDVMLTLRAVDSIEFARELDKLGMRPWVAWLVDQLPAGAAPDGLLETLKDSDASLSNRIRLRYVLRAGTNRSQTLTHAARLPFPNSALYAGAMAFPSREFLRRRADGGASRYHWFVGRAKRRQQPWAWAEPAEATTNAGGGRG